MGPHGNDDDDDDDIGPSVAPAADRQYLTSSNVRNLYAQANNLDSDNLPVGVSAEDHYMQAGTNRAATTGGAPANESNVREEWMLTPGENKSVADIYAASGQMDNRKFQTGKGAKKMADMYATQSAVIRNMEENKRKASDSSQADPQQSEQREPSLMELHLQQKGKQLKTSHRGGNGHDSEAVEDMFSFDRERVSIQGLTYLCACENVRTLCCRRICCPDKRWACGKPRSWWSMLNSYPRDSIKGQCKPGFSNVGMK
jgi:hypothetical protein